ncbi:hypothetical protein BCR37DRAFT_396458 [Protomyces lactucae-debilis]|uniref:Altered inheritance of mitochondria protein 11 n=1 Tax=Protomyces lactucae-debilis TaxID=2754530 RepID=A0A1Y2FUF3_PROLT|nr:uncharacterized protein BCR37DRAFT_396458 [Protomyces lactucae-debilis]ORY86826.1 hypothetical protein BCR37DRAFT_396458 [Protomyces lactucae-debilis]
MQRDTDQQQQQHQGSSYLLTAAATAFLIGLTVALSKTRKQAHAQPLPFFRSNAAHDHDPDFSPVIHAAKAFGMGTLLCCGSATVVVWAASTALDVHSLPEFSIRMRQLLGKAAPKLQQRLRDVDTLESPGWQQQQQDQGEWDAVWAEGRRIDQERAEVKRRRKEKKQKQQEQGQGQQDEASA